MSRLQLPPLVRAALAAASLALGGCHSGPAGSLRLLPDSDQNRRVQTREFRDVSEPSLLAACTGALQDMGFGLDETEGRLGVLTGSRGCPDRTLSVKPSARKTTTSEIVLGVVVVGAAVAVLAANPGLVLGGLLSGGGSSPPPPRPEQVRVMLVVKPAAASDAFLVRATFHSVLTTDSGGSSRVAYGEPVNAPAFYHELFGKLASSLSGEPQTP